MFKKRTNSLNTERNFVPGMGLEPTRPEDTWPSTMPVYQFQHPGVSALNKKS